ncbi:MAG: hypothetical protein ACFFCW_44300 [Candidatus Hodarchaeota archaeon]
MKYNYRTDKQRKWFFWSICFVALALSFCITFKATGSECLEKLFAVKFEGYAFFSISPSANYILVQIPIEELPEGTEFGPGGVFRLYNKQGVLLWEREYKGDLLFCPNEAYLMQPSAVEFESVERPAIHYLKDGNLFFRLPDKDLEVRSFDVSQKGDMIVAGLFDATIFLMHKGKKVWTYSPGMGIFADVAFSNNGNFFMDGLNNILFSFDKHGVVHKIDAPIVKEKLQSFDHSDLKDSIHFIFGQTRYIYKYIPQENKLYFLDLSYVKEAKGKLLIGHLNKKYHIQPKKIIFSAYLDHVGVITDDAFHYFRIKCKEKQ